MRFITDGSLQVSKELIKVRVGIPESFKVGWYALKITGSSHLNNIDMLHTSRPQEFLGEWKRSF